MAAMFCHLIKNDNLYSYIQESVNKMNTHNDLQKQSYYREFSTIAEHMVNNYDPDTVNNYLEITKVELGKVHMKLKPLQVGMLEYKFCITRELYILCMSFVNEINLINLAERLKNNMSINEKEILCISSNFQGFVCTYDNNNEMEDQFYACYKTGILTIDKASFVNLVIIGLIEEYFLMKELSEFINGPVGVLLDILIKHDVEIKSGENDLN